MLKWTHLHFSVFKVNSAIKSKSLLVKLTKGIENNPKKGTLYAAIK